ncbi:integrase catalytic domain-containing protein [Trichonephila clavipes]|nr:integrase catalytic domain-containing protein [Trichonephila clavipes]
MKNADGRIKVDLSELYDLLESKLMRLESLGRTKEKFAEFLEPLVESCLRKPNEVQSEMIKLARTGLGASRVSHPRSQPDEPDCSTAAALVNFQDNSDAIGIADPTEDAKRKHAHSDFLSQFKENLSVLPDGRPVIKQASQTMKIRPVLDASARDKNQSSLKDCLNRGTNLIELIPNIIDRFRLYPIGLSSDIEKAFLQLSIIPEHRDYLRCFLPTVKETKIYRHCRVVFGICSSPFQLSACIDQLLENSPARFDDVTQKLKHSFYVDSCDTGVRDIQEQKTFTVKAINVMAKGCFKLRG